MAVESGTPAGSVTVSRTVPWTERHAIGKLVLQRSAIGILTLLVVSVVVFLATEVLPGNAAYAALGHSATPAQVHALEVQLHL